MRRPVKIYGAGSIGNHLANAACVLGYNVLIVDIDEKALDRMKNEIYPQRYGKWDENITLYNLKEDPLIETELICIGTPPSSHIDLLIKSLKYHKGPILVEKPLCIPNMKTLNKIKSLSDKQLKNIFVGYNHVVSKGCNTVEKLVVDKKIGCVLSLDIEFRENWKGIFEAHHWLSGPEESYLGNVDQGGGSSGEHSHALNLWQHFSRRFKLGKTKNVIAKYEFIKDKSLNYDSKSYFILETDTKFVGTVIQDVLTYPPRKKIMIQGSKGYIEWICHHDNHDDLIKLISKNNKKKEYLIKKSRPDDFIIELEHVLKLNYNDSSPINILNGIETMKTLIAAYKSSCSNKSVKI